MISRKKMVSGISCFLVLGHLFGGPGGIPDQFDLGGGDPRESCDLSFHLRYKGIGHRTGGRSERHPDPDLTRLVHVDPVDQPHLVEINRDLRVITSLEDVDHPLFQRFCVHRLIITPPSPLLP